MAMSSVSEIWKEGPAERDSTGRTDFKQEVTKPLRSRRYLKEQVMGPKQRLMAEAALIIKQDFTKIPLSI